MHSFFYSFISYSTFLFRFIFSLSIFSFSVSFGEIDHFEKIKKTFLYGSYQEQLKALNLYTPQNLNGKNRDDYLKSLDLLIKENPHSAEVYIKLIEVIEENKLKSHYSLFGMILTRDFLIKDFLASYKHTLIAKCLQTIANLELSQFSDLPGKFFSEEESHENNQRTLIASVRGIGVFKRASDKDKLMEKYKDITSPQVQEEILRSIAQFKDEKDVDFFRSIIYSEESRLILKWIAIVSLKEYPNSKLAFNILKSNVNSDNIDMRSRAIYAISFFKRKEIENLLIRATKEDNVKIRYQSVLGLAQYQSAKVNDLLKYKMKYDPEKSIRNKARDILIERNLVKKEE